MSPKPLGAEAAVLGLIETMAEGWNRHDLETFASPFAEDADFVDVVGRWWRGRREIADQHAERHRTPSQSSRLKTGGVSIRFIRPDVAVVHAGWELAGDPGPDGRGIPLRKGLLTFVASERRGRWQVDAAQNTDILVA